jgi:hypothetical protein
MKTLFCLKRQKGRSDHPRVGVVTSIRTEWIKGFRDKARRAAHEKGRCPVKRMASGL